MVLGKRKSIILINFPMKRCIDTFYNLNKDKINKLISQKPTPSMLLLLERWFDKPGKKTLHEVI
jgi:hypothetical protein